VCDCVLNVDARVCVCVCVCVCVYMRALMYGRGGWGNVQVAFSFLHTIARKREGALVALLRWLFDNWRLSDHYCPIDAALAQVHVCTE
jgi:hypothetical protein